MISTAYLKYWIAKVTMAAERVAMPLPKRMTFVLSTENSFSRALTSFSNDLLYAAERVRVLSNASIEVLMELSFSQFDCTA